VLVPSIAGALAKGDKTEASSKTSYSFLISVLLILPCAVGYMTLAQPIYRIIYPATPDGADLLSILSVALVFSALTQTLTGALPGIGKVFVPALSILVGCVFKVVLNIVLIRIPQINIYGAAISSIVCQIAAFMVNFIVLIKYIPLKITAMKYIVKPLIAGIIMGVSALGTYTLVSLITGNDRYITNMIATLVSIAVAALVYIVLIIGMKIMDKEDIMLLPAGGKIYSLLVKTKLYK
jgi:stage V sporulation protein B